jgi:hypothetical protein
MRNIWPFYTFLLLLLSLDASAQPHQTPLSAAVASVFSPHVSVLDIPMGTDLKTFEKELKAQGFKLKVERESEENDVFYGRYSEAFLRGEMAGNPASVRLKASRMTKTVFEAEVVLLSFIDVEEAVEFVNRLIPDDVALYPVVRKEDYGPGGTTFVEIVGKDKKVTKYLSLPWGRVFLRFYENEAKVETKDALGLLDAVVYQQTLDHSCIVSMRYYDAAAGEQARAEAGRKSF